MQDRLSYQEFERQLIDEIKRKLPNLDFRPCLDGSEYLVMVADGRNTDLEMNFRNDYNDYLAGEPVKSIATWRGLAARDWLNSMKEESEATASWQKVQTKLVLQVQTEGDSLGAGCPSIKLPYPGLFLRPMINLPNYLVGASIKHLEKWGVTEEAVLQEARKNTLRCLPKWQKRTLEGHRVWAASNATGFANSAIGLEEALRQLPVDPRRLWVASPCRDVALAFEDGQPGDAVFLPLMALNVQMLLRFNEHPVSPLLYQKHRRLVYKLGEGVIEHA